MSQHLLVPTLFVLQACREMDIPVGNSAGIAPFPESLHAAHSAVILAASKLYPALQPDQQVHCRAPPPLTLTTLPLPYPDSLPADRSTTLPLDLPLSSPNPQILDVFTKLDDIEAASVYEPCPRSLTDFIKGPGQVGVCLITGLPGASC
jgi:hypothetical protein